MNIIPDNSEIYINEIVYEKPTPYGPRMQTAWQLVYMVAGDARIEVTGEGACRLRAGQAVILLPGYREMFRFASEGRTRHGWVLVRLPDGVEVAPEHRPPMLRVVPFGAGLQALAEAVSAFAEPDHQVRNPLGRALADCLFRGCLDPAIAQTAGKRQPHPAIARAQEAMRKGFGGPLNLADLARAAGVTPAHLIRLFRRETGRTPAQELRRIRLLRAEEMLVNSGWQVAEIAHRCGFADPQHFSKCFRAERGLPPGRYRKAFWAESPPAPQLAGSDRENRKQALT